MAKNKKKKGVEVSINGKSIDMKDILERRQNKDYDIIGATLKDDFCNYTVRTNTGQMEGEEGTFKGPLIISDDLRNAFNRLKVHLAVIDDAFNLSLTEINNIDEEHNHEFTHHYDVSGFKIKGADENIQVSLIGSKHLNTVLGRMACVTPNILLAAGTDYKWYNELLTEIENCQKEVALYKEGKGMRPDNGQSKEDPAQTKITDDDQQEVKEEEV